MQQKRSAFTTRRMGQPFGGLPASAYIPDAAILPTSSPTMFPMVTMPPSAPILVDTYTPPVVVPAETSMVSSTTLYWVAGLAGAGLLGYLLARG